MRGGNYERGPGGGPRARAVKGAAAGGANGVVPNDRPAARAGAPPNRGGRLVAALGRRWYVEVSGSGPAALLVHGTGASTRSWGRVAPLLAERCTVVAVDPPESVAAYRAAAASSAHVRDRKSVV